MVTIRNLRSHMTQQFPLFSVEEKYYPSVLWRCWLGGRKGIRPVKNWVVGCWRGCLEWRADLHIAHQMPLPLTFSCFSKSRLVLTFLVLPYWYLLTRVVPDIFQKSSKTVVCVCVCVFIKFWNRLALFTTCASFQPKSPIANFNKTIRYTARHSDVRKKVQIVVSCTHIVSLRAVFVL